MPDMVASALQDTESEPSGPDPRDALIASLRASERQARRIVESAIDYAIVGIDLDGIVTSWSAGAQAILGWSEQEAVGRPASLFFTEDDKRHGVALSEMQQALEDGSASDERWHLKRDGTRFWANGRMMKLRDEAGTVQGFVKILRDRTPERNAAVRQQADAEFLRRVLEASEDCIKVLEADRRINFVSASGQRLLGLTRPDQLHGKDWVEVWQEPFRSQALDACAAALRGESSAFRGVGTTPGGLHKVWDVRVTPMRDADGTPEKILVVSRDITEHSSVNEALRRTEGHWRGLFERLQEGFVLGELVRGQDGSLRDWRCVEVNAAWEPLTGLSREATLGRTISEAIPGLDQSWIDIVGQVVESGEAVNFTAPIPQLNRWFECHAYPLERERFAVLFVNVTEQRRIDGRRTALLSLGDRLRDLDDPGAIASAAAEILGRTLDADRAGYGSVDRDGGRLTIETEWARPDMGSVLGTFATLEYGQHIDALLAGEIVAISDARTDPRTRHSVALLEAIQVAAKIDVPLIEAGRLVAVFFVTAARPRLWDREEVAFARTVAERARSAIERCRAEHALRDLAASLERKVEERTRERDQVWRASRDLLCIVTPEGRFVSLNPAWTATLGWSVETLTATPFLDFVHPEDRDSTIAAADGLRQGQAQLGFENRYRCSDDSYRWLSWNAVLRDGLIYATIRDVTEIREQERLTRALEEQLRQSQKMEAVGQLTGGIAHDFNNLLTGISGSLELLGTRVAQGRFDEVARHVAAAQGAARRAASLTHRLLAFSRRQTLESRATDINRLVEEMEELIRRTVGPGIEIVVRGAAGLGTAQIDPNQLENALLNLCLNARDAMPDGGRITIATANLTLARREDVPRGSALPPGDYVTVSVADTGTGMTPEVIARAFDPFFTTKPIGQGTGLGLSMIYGFVRQSGGEVRIESRIGRGTSMELILPRHAAGAAPSDAGRPGEQTRDEAAMALAGEGAAGATVLVVDDEPTVRSFVSEVLSDRGYRVIEAGDGQEGLAVLRSEATIDLLLTDVGLPGGMNGRQLADAGRVLRPSLQTLFITGYAEHALVGDGALEPGMHVMTKPFEMDVLAARIAALVDRRTETG